MTVNDKGYKRPAVYSSIGVHYCEGKLVERRMVYDNVPYTKRWVEERDLLPRLTPDPTGTLPEVSFVEGEWRKIE